MSIKRVSQVTQGKLLSALAENSVIFSERAFKVDVREEGEVVIFTFRANDKNINYRNALLHDAVNSQVTAFCKGLEESYRGEDQITVGRKRQKDDTFKWEVSTSDPGVLSKFLTSQVSTGSGLTGMQALVKRGGSRRE